MATEEEQQRVAKIVMALPMPLRKVFVMVYVEGKPQAQVAAELHISQRRLERRLTKALRVCRERFIA